MASKVETRHVDGVWEILLKGSLLSILWGVFLFGIVPGIAIRLMPLAGITTR